MIATFSDFRRVRIYQRIKYSVWTIYPGKSNAVVRKEHFHQIFKSYTTTNEVIAIMWTGTQTTSFSQLIKVSHLKHLRANLSKTLWQKEVMKCISPFQK